MRIQLEFKKITILALILLLSFSISSIATELKSPIDTFENSKSEYNSFGANL